VPARARAREEGRRRRHSKETITARETGERGREARGECNGEGELPASEMTWLLLGEVPTVDFSGQFPASKILQVVFVFPHRLSLHATDSSPALL